MQTGFLFLQQTAPLSTSSRTSTRRSLANESRWSKNPRISGRRNFCSSVHRAESCEDEQRVDAFRASFYGCDAVHYPFVMFAIGRHLMTGLPWDPCDARASRRPRVQEPCLSSAALAPRSDGLAIAVAVSSRTET
jgi:hypothetical protein